MAADSRDAAHSEEGRPAVVEPAFEPGSFRDPDSRVVVAGGTVFRTLSPTGLEDWRALAESALFERAVADGRLVGTEEADGTAVPAELRDGAAAVLRHEAIPFVSYPYEWPFSMLKEAALLQLSLLDEAIGCGLMLKDSSPYNVQWRGTTPVFIDIGSFEKLREGEPWAGYRQFCMLFLYPLLLQAYKGIEYQTLLRGAIDGISPVQARCMFSARDLLRRGVLTHVALHARLERRYADSAKDVKGELKKAGFKTELIRANVRGLKRLVERLEWEPGATAWTGYRTQNTYTDADAERKAAFVREAASSRRRRLVWDIGANDGRYTRIAAEHADHALAIDADQAVVDALYRSLREEGSKTILPLVMNVADPSPGLGWRGQERKTLPERGTPDLTLCLALVHHVVIGSNVPMREFLDWLRELGTEVVIEFPTPEDPMAARLLARKREGTHDDYTQESFERALSEAFEVERSERLESGTRVLYRARPHA